MAPKTPLPELQNLLPKVLRDSKLPWEPLCDSQAPVPRDWDGWRCLQGPLRLELDAFDFSWCSKNPNPGSITYTLRLIYSPLDQELRFQHSSSLEVLLLCSYSWLPYP